jgi:dihydropteroate synthase
MGVLNTTPDSFSGDGLAGRVEAAVARATRFEKEGADIIDIGGESTRPGSTPVNSFEEIERVIPVIKRVAQEVTVPISIDTSKTEVAVEALKAGATMINDVWGLRRDPSLAKLSADNGAPIIVMHNQISTDYDNLLIDVIAGLQASLDLAIRAGIQTDHIIVDPGLGFGKTAGQNLEVMRNLKSIEILEKPILVGTSRKSTIGLVLNLPVEERLEGTAATVAIAIANGADIVRVHDVKEMARVARMSDSIVRGWKEPESEA